MVDRTAKILRKGSPLEASPGGSDAPKTLTETPSKERIEKTSKKYKKRGQNGAEMEPKCMKNRCQNVVAKRVEKNIEKTSKIYAKM